VLLDPKAKVAGVGEVFPAQFVFLDFQPSLEDLLRLGAADGDVDGDLFVATDAKGSDGVTCFGCDGCLSGELLEDLGRSC
jgi:hypothetical protein